MCLRRCASRDLDAFANADVPFERLVELLNPTRSTAHHPLFQVILSLHNSVPMVAGLPGLDVVVEEIDPGIAKVDLQFTLMESYTADQVPGGIELQLTYATDLFDGTTVEEMASDSSGCWRLWLPIRR